MSQCTLAQQNSIVDLIRESFEIYGSVDLNDLELEISQVLLEGFTFKEFSDNTDIINTLKEYGVNTEELIGNVSSSPLKSNIVKNISTYKVEDLFKGIPTAKLYFDGYLDNLMVKNAIIGSSDSETYVSSDLELTSNLHNLKNDLFIEIQDFLKSKGILTTDPVDLFENGRVKDFSNYSHVMNLISEYFFSGNDVSLFSFSGKLIPNLNISLENNESVFRAYNNMILLSNFDSVLNNMFKGMIEVNYNYFNHLDSVIDNKPKYKLKVSANSLLYWNKDTHDSKSSENKEDKITKMIVGSIPMYNKTNVKTSDFMEMKDLYLFASMIHNFELKFGNKFKNNDNYNFEYFNKNSNDSLYWYITQIKKSINKEDGFISELNESLKNDPNNKHGYSFKNISNIIYSLDNFLNDSELNIEAKEKTSKNSLVSLITQVLNNNYGSTYSVFDTKHGLKVQNKYQQDFNNTYINDTVLNYMKSTNVDKNMYNLRNLEEFKRFNKLFDPEGAKFLPDDIEEYAQENPNFVEEFSKYITEKTGIPFSRMSFQTLVTEMKDFHNLPVISGDYLKNKLGDLIRNMQTVKSSKSFNDFAGNSDIETSGKILSPVVSSSFYITLSNVYLANFVTKPIMNIETAVGNKVPSFRSTVLVFKDTELFDLQREFQKDKNYKSLLLTDVPAILGTSTKLEINSTDSSGNVTSKDAVKATVGESFIADFKYEFWDSIIKNDTFQIILGNYSDKNSVFTKIINANYNLPNSKIPVIQEDIGKILQTVRLQGLNFYTDSLNRIFTDYKELLSKTGYAKESNQLSDNIENNIKVINSVLSKANIIDIIRTYSKLPYDQKSKDLTITEELHYSYYSDGTFINQTLADNYRIFGDEDLFAQFVEIQENSFIDNYNNEFPKNDNKIIFNNNKGLKTNEFNKIIEKLNIPKSDFSNNADMESLVLNSGEINPLIKKWLWLNSLFRNEYIFMTAKGEHMHPHKNNSASRSGEFNEDYWDNYRNEVSGRLSSMAKRNVIFTASVETPTRNTKMGVPDNVNVAAIADNSALVFTPSGYKKYNQDAYDGSSYIDDTYNRMIESSFPGKGYSGTKKQFGTLITPYGVTIKKDAETVITNDKIRNSFNSQVSLLNKKKQMLGIPLSDLMLDFEQEYYDKYFLDKGLLKSITKVKLEYNPTTNSNQIKIWTNTETSNGWFFNKPETHPVNTLFDVWSVLGGMYSADEHRNFTEGSNELLYDIVTNEVALKDKIIHILSNKSALKAGATNLNHKDLWFNDDTLMYSTYKNRFMGPQLDASHGVDNSEIKEITQLISALAQNGYTSAIAQEAYNDIASVIKKSAQPYIDNLSSDNSNLYQYLTNKFIDTINNSKGESLAKSLIHHLKQDKVKIPFSNVNFFNMFVKDVVTRLNDEFISRHYSGIGSILLPSHGVVQLYDKLVDGREITMTQQDLIKEALINYNQEDFVSRYGREPQSNFEIIEDYKNIILADEEIVNNYFEVGDTIKVTFFDSSETLYTLTTPEDYYKLKEIISQYQQTNVRYNLFKVRNVPRDLKPTMHNFSVNNVKHNVYDFKSIKMLYTLKNLISDLKKGKTIDINSDLQDLSEFGDVIAKRNNSSYNLLSNLTTDSLPVISELEKHLRRFVQREFDLLNHNLYLNHSLPIANVVGNDTFLNPVTDVLQHYSSMSNLVENLNFKPAEKIIGDIYQTIFNRDSNDSMYDIYNQGSEYFKNKISKYYDNDTTESDLKIYTSRSDNPIYIKYVDELGPLDRTINISSSIDSDEGLKKAYIRYNEQGEEVYSFADPDNIRVSTDENGNEIIYIKYGTRFKNGHHRSKSFNKNLKSIIRSFKGSLQAIVPLMNRDDNKVNFYNYVINDAGKSVIDENNISEFNLSEVSVNIFKNFSGYNQDVDNYYDSSWVQVNKENILNTLSNKTFASWQKSHDLIDARIPGQSMQSFMPMRNVAYMNTLTNDSYVSINQIFLQGSDFDIDKAYTLGSTFTSKGNLELWSDLTNYSTIEQLNELEKLPIPSGVEIKSDVSGIDITNDYLEIEQALKDLDYSYELPTKAISLFNALIRKIGNDNVIIKDVLTPVNINEISDFEGTLIEYVNHIGVHPNGRPIGARNINKGEKIQLALNILQDTFNNKNWTNPVNSEPLPEDIFSNFEEFISFVLLHEKAHEYILIQPNEDLKSYETRINNEALRRLGKTETSIMPQQIIDFINKHNLSDSYLKEGEAIKNSIVSRIKQISSNPSNQIIANTPVDVQDWHDAIKKVQKNRGKINKKSVGVNSIASKTYSKLRNKTESTHIILPGRGDLEHVKYKRSNFWSEVVPEAKAYHENNVHPILIAYNGNKNKSFLENYLNGNVIGNPFGWQSETGSKEEKEKKSTIKFIDYLITGNNYGEPNATPEYREALVKDIKSEKWKGNLILHHEEKGYATHATALDYLINNSDSPLNTNITDIANRAISNASKTNIVLTPEQTLAKSEILNFFNNKSKGTYSLIGYAGTGKTTVIKELKREFESQGHDVVFSTPTHRANTVISSKDPLANVMTLHSLLGLSPDVDLENFDSKNVKFSRGDSGPKINSNSILIIDESSMINDSLFEFINNTLSGNKILYVGDSAQLKPVKSETLSKALTSTEGTSTLTTVMRTDSPSLLNELLNVRNTGDFSFESSVENNKGIVFTKNESSFLSTAADAFRSEDFKNDPLYARILAYSNKSVSSYNVRIREMLFGKDAEEFMVGEPLFGYANLIKDQLGGYGINNGIDYKILKSSPYNKIIPGTDVALSGYNLQIQDVFSKETKNIFIVSKNESQANINFFKNVVLDILNKAKKSKYKSAEYGAFWGQYYRLQDSFIFTKDIKYIDGWGEEKGLINKGLDYGYAHTIHKSQGGTYNYTFVSDIGISSQDSDLSSQLRYVGVTRSENISTVYTPRAKSDDVDLITFVSDLEISDEVDEENEIMEIDEENITESDYLSPYDILSYYRQQYNASVGKDDVGIAANGVKSLYALSSYYNTYYGGDLESDLSNSFKTFHKTLTFQRNGKTLTLGGDFTTIADVQMSDKTKNILVSHNPKFNVRYVNAANNVSGFLSAATDNAKELIMAKVNASTDLAAMHLYMLILGFDIEAVVEIMTSDEMVEIIKNMEGNIFTTGSDKSFLNIVKSLKSEYAKAKDWDKVHNLNTYENIYRSSQELTTLSRLLGINQKRSADTWEIYKYLNIFSKAISDAESKYTIPKQVVAGKVSTNLDKYAESLVKENKVPLDLNYVKNVLINAEKHNILEGGFDFEQYFENPEYKQVTKEYYNIIKETFNVFDIIDEVPHFKEMVNSLVLFHNILKRFSSKYDYIFDTYRNVTSDQNPDKTMLNRGILYYDTKSREDWLKSESMLDFTFNLKELMKLANKNEINIYVSSEARMNSKKDAYTTTINVDDDSNPIISLDTNEGIANFKLMFEQLLLPVLQANLKDSNFLKLDSTFSEFGLKRTTITPTIPLSNSNVPALIKQFQKALLNFNNLDRSFDIKYQIKNNTGEYVKWRDLLFVYNLLINNERYGNKRLTPLFQDYMQEKDTLGYDYIKFWSDIDSNRDLSLDNSDIQFYALNEKGVLNRMVSNNPDFVITTDLKTTEADKIYNKNINDIVRLLKEGGFIITLKC